MKTVHVTKSYMSPNVRALYRIDKIITFTKKKKKQNRTVVRDTSSSCVGTKFDKKKKKVGIVLYCYLFVYVTGV